MTQIALQINSTLNAENYVAKNDSGQSPSGATGKAASDAGILPFSLILTKIVGKLNQSAGSSTSPGQVTGIAADNGATVAEKGNVPVFMLKIKELLQDQEKGDASADAAGINLLSLLSQSKCMCEQGEGKDITVEIDLQALLDAARKGEINEENQTGSDEAGASAFMSSLLQTIIAALGNINGEETGMTRDEILSFLNGSLSADGTNNGGKILLALPKELLQGFGANKNGQPYFELNPVTPGSPEGQDTTAAGQNPSGLTVDPVSGEPIIRLVRVNPQVTGSSLQGSLLAAAAGLSKTDPSNAATPDAATTNTDMAADAAVNPFEPETLVKDAGERSVRDLLLKTHATDVAGKDSSPVADAARTQEAVAQSRADSVKGADAFKEVLIREDKAKNTPVISGRDSNQWVPLAGAASPHLSPESETVIKGVFVPMDRVVQEAGALLEKGAGKVQMTLQPPSLGTINMEVLVRSNRVELVLTANHAEVQQLLQANADQLKNALSNQGFQIDQMSMLLKHESFGFNLGGHSLWQDSTGQQSGNSGGSTTVTAAPEVEAIMPRPDYGSGIISIFA